MVNDTVKVIEDLFDLGDLKSHDNTQAEEYECSSVDNEPFEKLTEGINIDIEESKDKGINLELKENKEDPHDIVKDVSSKKCEKKDIIESKEPMKEHEVHSSVALDTVSGFDSEWDSIPEKEDLKEEALNEDKEIQATMGDDIFNPDAVEELDEEVLEKPKVKEGVLDEIPMDSKSMLDGDKLVWSLNSSSSMYDTFYDQKKIVLDSCLAGGQVEFSIWNKELEEAQVDVVTEVFDQQLIIRQMEEIQQFRNRVKFIGVRVNNQYFLFDRFTPLLRGYLARIQYLKPVLKQDGLILEHMGDVELYFERLRALHKSVSDTEKNLAAAYDMLSRKVTICMELPPAERYNKESSKSYKAKFSSNEESKPQEEESEPQEEEFDGLPYGAKAGYKEKVSGPCSWGDM